MALTKNISIIFQVLQNKCAQLILKQPSRTHASPLLQSLHWLPIEKRILFKLTVQAFKAFHFSSPGYLSSYFQPRVHKTKYSLRSDLAITFEVPRAKKQAGYHAFSVAGPHLWNGLPSSVRTVDHMDRFKNKLKVAWSATVSCSDLLENDIKCVYWQDNPTCQVSIFSKKPFLSNGILCNPKFPLTYYV